MNERPGGMTQVMTHNFVPNSHTGLSGFDIFCNVFMIHVRRYKICVFVVIAEDNPDKLEDVAVLRLGPNLQLSSKTLVIGVKSRKAESPCERKLTKATRR